MLPDGAGVEHDEIRLPLEVRERPSVLLEQPRDRLGVQFVHLTAVGAQIHRAGGR